MRFFFLLLSLFHLLYFSCTRLAVVSNLQVKSYGTSFLYTFIFSPFILLMYKACCCKLFTSKIVWYFFFPLLVYFLAYKLSLNILVLFVANKVLQLSRYSFHMYRPLLVFPAIPSIISHTANFNHSGKYGST